VSKRRSVPRPGACVRSAGVKRGHLFVVSGPSGSGKTTIVDALVAAPGLKGLLVKSVSFTTRPKRSYEKDGIDYFFVTKRRFLEERRRKKILEWTRYLGYYYGTPKERIDRRIRQGTHVIFCLDYRGASRIKRLYPADTTIIFVMPPSLAELKKRIRQRCTKTQQTEIRKRLGLAKQELCLARRYDYQFYNKDLKKVLRQLTAIIKDKMSGLPPAFESRSVSAMPAGAIPSRDNRGGE